LARLHFNLLEQQSTRKRLISALNQLPEDLDDTYTSAIDRILSQNREHANTAMRALKWITFAKRYLHGLELLHALAVAPDGEDVEEDDLMEPEKLISICAGLLIMDSESGQIRLVHYTTQKYLRSRIESDGDAEIARTCLRYLSLRTFSEPFLDHRGYYSRLQKYALSSYAALHWSEHVQGPSESDFHCTILRTFGNQEARNIIFQIRENKPTAKPNMTTFLFASMCGLSCLCNKLLNESFYTNSRYVFLWSLPVTHEQDARLSKKRKCYGFEGFLLPPVRPGVGIA
jgi:hypothetical protein